MTHPANDSVPKHESMSPRAAKVYEAGYVIAGKYQLEALLGQGGMGAVWRAGVAFLLGVLGWLAVRRASSEPAAAASSALSASAHRGDPSAEPEAAAPPPAPTAPADASAQTAPGRVSSAPRRAVGAPRRPVPPSQAAPATGSVKSSPKPTSDLLSPYQ